MDAARPLDPIPLTPLAERLRAARGDTSQSLLAKHAGLSQPSISQWERALTEPSAQALESIARVLGVSLGWLTTGEGEMRPAAADPQSPSAA